jgi:hypothetical protein
MPLAAKKGHNGRKTWVKGWDRMSITMPNLGHRNHVRNTWAPAITKFFELTGVDHLRRPKNAMNEGENVLCCFFTSSGLFRDVADNWLVCWFALGRGNFREPTAESGFFGPLCADEPS